MVSKVVSSVVHSDFGKLNHVFVEWWLLWLLLLILLSQEWLKSSTESLLGIIFCWNIFFFFWKTSGEENWSLDLKSNLNSLLFFFFFKKKKKLNNYYQ